MQNMWYRKSLIFGTVLMLVFVVFTTVSVNATITSFECTTDEPVVDELVHFNIFCGTLGKMDCLEIWIDFGDGYGYYEMVYDGPQKKFTIPYQFSHIYENEGEYTVNAMIKPYFERASGRMYDLPEFAAITIEVTSADPVDMINGLIGDIEDMDLHHGLENSLIKKLNNAIKSIEKNKINAGINKLNSLINHVEAQRGKKLTEAQADHLVASAQAIIDSL